MSASDPNRVQAVFLLVADAPDATARAAILERECGTDMELRRQVVELLEAHDRSGSFMNHPVVQPVPLGETRPTEARAALPGKPAQASDELGASPGALIAGRFRVLELIGEGGMGAVWRAEQREPVKRLVALKLIKPGMDSRQVLSRFEAERQALAVMDHPNIAKVFDGGMTDQGRPYFVMEYVRGIPITKYCDEARLSLKDRLAIFMQVCEAVQHAHQKGIIHRDLKPSNILVCLYDGKPVPKVIDFGLAKAMHQSLTEHTLYTAHGLMVGTPLYMSPEQAEFNNLDIDTRSDVYSLGVILYELLTGTTPLEKQQFKDAVLQEILRLIKEEEPQKPSTKLSGSGSLPSIAAQRRLEPAQLSRAMRGDLDWIVMKSLEKERSRRYETASGLARDIDRYLHDEPVEACPPSATYRLKKLIRRNKGPVAAALAVLLTLVIGVIGTTLGLIEARHQEGIALAAAGEERKAREAESQRAEAEVKERKRAEEAEKLAKERLDEVSKEKDRADEYVAIAIAVNDFLCNDVLGQADSHKQADRKYVPDPNLTVRTALDRAAEKIDRALFDKSDGVEAWVRRTIGDAYYGLGEYDKAIEQLELAAEIYNEGLGPEGPNTLTTLNNLANSYLAVGRMAEGIALAEQVRDNGIKTFGADHEQTFVSANNLAMQYEDAGRVDEAIPMLEKALESARKGLGEDNLQTLILQGNLARAYESAGRPAEAIALMDKSQQAFTKSLGPNDPHTLVATVDLARFYVGDERCAEAIALLERSRESCAKTLGPDHPGTLTAVHNLARAYLHAGRTADSISLMQEVCDARTKKLGERDPETLNALHSLAAAYKQAGRTADAIKLLEQVRDVQTAALGANHPQSLSTKVDLALSYDEAGRTDEAIELQKDVRRRYSIKSGNAHPDTITASTYLADMFAHAGKLGSTILLLEQTRDNSEKKLGPDDLHTMITQSRLALAYNECGRTADALAIWDAMLPHASAKLEPLNPKLLTIRHGWIESLEQDNQSTKADELRKELISDERKAFQQDDAKLGQALAQHGRELLKALKWAEAEATLRESIVLLERKEPDKWSIFHARSLLGEALLRQERYTDAEPLLLAGYDGLHERATSLPGSSKKFLPDAARRLVKLYQATGKTDLAQEWQQKLAAIKLPDFATDAQPEEIAIAPETTKELPENVLSAADARTLKLLIGKEVEVEGTIVTAEWTSTGKSMQIQFAGNDRNPFGLAAVMFEASRGAFDAAFGGDAASSFANARIRLRGKLVIYGGFRPQLKGASQMILSDPAQVTILK